MEQPGEQADADDDLGEQHQGSAKPPRGEVLGHEFRAVGKERDGADRGIQYHAGIDAVHSPPPCRRPRVDVARGALLQSPEPLRRDGLGLGSATQAARHDEGHRVSRVAVITSSPPFGAGGHLVIAKALVSALQCAGHDADRRHDAVQPVRAAGERIPRHLADRRARGPGRPAGGSRHQPAVSELCGAPPGARVLAESPHARVLRPLACLLRDLARGSPRERACAPRRDAPRRSLPADAQRRREWSPQSTTIQERLAALWRRAGRRVAPAGAATAVPVRRHTATTCSPCRA